MAIQKHYAHAANTAKSSASMIYNLMSTQPINVAALVAEREQIQQWLKTAQAREMEIRTTLCSHFFSNPKEGTQRTEEAGYVFKLVQPITRKLDEAALDTIMPQMPEQFRQLGVLIKYSAGLVKAGYDALTEQDRKVFDQALTISAGAPQLTIEKAEAVNPSQAGATPDWPAKVATPIMDAYHTAKYHTVEYKSSEDAAMEAHEQLRKQSAAKKASKPATKPTKKKGTK